MTKCKICGCLTSSFIENKKKYYYCSSCSFVFLDSSFIVSPKLEKERYLKHENTLSNKGYVSMLSSFISKIPVHGHVLDFGCGPTLVLKKLISKKGFSVDAYDKYFHPCELSKYDVITCTEVVEHLSDPLSTLKMLKEHLNSSGCIAVMTLFHPKDLSGWWYLSDETHISFFDKKTFVKMGLLLDMDVEFINDKNVVVLKKNYH